AVHRPRPLGDGGGLGRSRRGAWADRLGQRRSQRLPVAASRRGGVGRPQPGARGSGTMRTFVFSGGKSKKFWNIPLQGRRLTVSFGKVGGKGQTQRKDYPDEETARKAHDKLVAEKLGKGYVETTAGPPSPSPTPLQQSLEEALVESPDDLAAHAAYADYLTEQ